MQYTILLIEDKTGLRDTLQSLLELHHYQVITAANGQEGIQLATAHLPNLVISDIYMPVLNGYQLLEAFQAHEKLRNIPVIILSARSAREEITLALEKGAAAYINKPFLFANLNANIRELLHTSGTATLNH
ncbi:response regulator [Chitinophaga sp.]|uniref:response regulator n=1 Tax=Chitinophaga sp. TaxID=1869181 RepID=UPI0031DE78F3